MSDQDSNLSAPPLRGEAAPGKFGVRTGDGVPGDASRAVFPIVRFDPEGRVDLLGTGFYITTTGLFVTARHVLQAPFDRQTGQQTYPIAIVHLYEKQTYLFRPVLRCAFHPVADVTVGVAAPMNRGSDGAPLTNQVLTLSTVPADPHSHVVTFAYPKYVNIRLEDTQMFNVMPAYYDGEIIEYLPSGRDRVLLPGPCYRTSIAIHHGASGGPVFSRAGTVFAINSTGFDGTDDSYVSSINAILDLTIDDVAMDHQGPRSVPVRELIRSGHIVVKPLL